MCVGLTVRQHRRTKHATHRCCSMQDSETFSDLPCVLHADSDTAPCGMGGTCTSVLATLMRSGSNSSTATSPPKAGSNAHAGGFVSSSRQAPSTRSHLARSQRHSRSCSHLPDVLGPVGGFSWAPGPPSAGAGTGGAAAGRGSFEGDAVPAVEMLLTQPRDPFRRRQGGRWGRKRIVVSGKDQH